MKSADEWVKAALFSYGEIEMSAEVRYFEDFELDPSAYRLSRGGEVIRLERIPLELLSLLVERCGQTVTRDEILARIWGNGVFIDSEHGINTLELIRMLVAQMSQFKLELGEETLSHRIVPSITFATHAAEVPPRWIRRPASV